MRRAARKKGSSIGGQRDLALSGPAVRLHALRRERARLLKEIDQTKRSLLRIRDEMESTSVEVMAAIGPLIEQRRRVEGEIHALFAALLAPGRLTKRKRSQVRKAYATLQMTGLIEDVAGGPAGDEAWDDDVFGGFDARHLPPDPEEPAGGSATKPADDGTQSSLRALFKRLVVALHPDRAVDEDEKARRTAAMKDVTRAYESSDLARLIDLDDRFSNGAPLGESVEDPGVAVEALARIVAELKAQVRELLAELRSVQRSERYRAARDLTRAKKVGEDPLALMKEEEKVHLDDLVAARDFVSAFDSGKIGLRGFVRGPSLPSGAAGNDEALIAKFIAQVLDGIDIDARPRRRPSRRRAKAAPIPF